MKVGQRIEIDNDEDHDVIKGQVVEFAMVVEDTEGERWNIDISDAFIITPWEPRYNTVAKDFFEGYEEAFEQQEEERRKALDPEETHFQIEDISYPWNCSLCGKRNAASKAIVQYEGSRKSGIFCLKHATEERQD